MTDEKSAALPANEDTSTDKSDQTSSLGDKDWFLSSLVNLVNDTNISMSITLNVGGTIVSGTLIGGSDYFEGFANEMASAFPDKDAAESIRGSYAQFAQIYPKRPIEETEEDPEENRVAARPSYIHLKNARFYANGQPSIPGNKGVWWRGRLTAVDGFSLGGLDAS